MTRVVRGCCDQPRLVRSDEVLHAGEFYFPVVITYCAHCGRVNYTGTNVSDGERRC